MQKPFLIGSLKARRLCVETGNKGSEEGSYEVLSVLTSTELIPID